VTTLDFRETQSPESLGSMIDNESVESEPRATHREWIGLAVLALPTLLAAMDFSVLFMALPHLTADLHASGTQSLWVMDVYGFMVAGFLVTMGTLGDRIGRKRLLMTGAAMFGILSLVAAYSVSPEMLIVARALLGIAGATLMPSTLALITNMFRNPRQRATAISLWATCLLVGTIIGPVIGGLLLEFFWWGSTLLLGVPMMGLLLITAPRLLPEYRNTGAGRLDPVSVILSLASVLPIVYGFKELATNGLDPMPIIVMIAGIGMGTLFVQRQRKLSDPLLDLRLFKSRSFSLALGILLLGAIVSGGAALLFTQYLQLVQGLSPLRAGLWLIPDTVGMIASSLLAPVIARRFRPASVIGAGLITSAVGFLVLTQVHAGSGMAVAVTGIVIVFFGVAPTWVLGTDLVVGSSAPERAGAAAALSETSSELGIAMGVAMLGSVATSVYRATMAQTLPADLAPEVAGSASETLVGAEAAAAHLATPLATALIDTARDAFTHGFAVTAAISAPVMAGVAIIAFILLRHTRPSGEPAPAIPKEVAPSEVEPALVFADA